MWRWIIFKSCYHQGYKNLFGVDSGLKDIKGKKGIRFFNGIEN